MARQSGLCEFQSCALFRMFLLCVRWCDIDRVYKIFEILSPSAKVGSVIAEQDSILFFDGSSTVLFNRGSAKHVVGFRESSSFLGEMIFASVC